jgi:hypothetical protein
MLDTNRFRFQVSGVIRFQVSGVRCQEKIGVRFQVSGVRKKVESGFRARHSGFKVLIRMIQVLGSNVKAKGSEFAVSALVFLTPDT